MVTAQAAFTTQWGTHPYLQPAEYLHAPTSVDTSSLTVDGTVGDQTQELRNCILRASAWMDNYCNQALWATLDIETTRARTNRRGKLFIHPKCHPILEVRDVQFGGLPSQLSSLSDLSNVWIEEQTIIVDSVASTTFSGSLNYGSPRPGGELYVRYAYVNGWPDTTINASIAAGVGTLTVADSTGIYGGPTTALATASTPPATQLTIIDGELTETVSVASVAGNVLTLNGVTQHAHQARTDALLPVTALLPSVREAAILATSAAIKTRGNEALVMGSIEGGGGRISTSDASSVQDLMDARELLRPVRRVR